MLEELIMEDAEKVAEILTNWFGKKFKFFVFEELVNILGNAKVSKLSGVSRGGISNALRRRSIGDDMFYSIIYGVVKAYPEVLKVALETALEKAEEENKALRRILEKLIDQKKEEKKTKI